MLRRNFIFVSTTVLVLAACQPAEAPETAITVIEGATVIDGVSETVIEDAVIVIKGERIQSLGSRESLSGGVPDGARTIDATGKTIMPGIFNLHGHVGRTEGMERSPEFYNRQRIQRDANAYLYYGVTHMISLGMDWEPMTGFRADQRAGTAGGARLYTAGFGFSVKDGWIPDNPDLHRPTTPEEARQMVQEEVQKESDVIKIWVDDGRGTVPKVSPEISGAIIDEAHKNGLKVLAHVYYLEDAKELLRRGLDGLAHSVRDKEVDEEFLALAKQNDAIQITTLVGHSAVLVYVDGADFLDDPGLPLLFPAHVLETAASSEHQQRLSRNEAIQHLRREYQMALTNAAKIAAAGIPIGVGTDSGGPDRFQGLWEHREMELLVQAGLTPMQAIQAATINGARFLGVDDRYGSLGPERIADFIILNANPLDDIRNSRNIDSVWMNGNPVDRSALPVDTTPR